VFLIADIVYNNWNLFSLLFLLFYDNFLSSLQYDLLKGVDVAVDIYIFKEDIDSLNLFNIL
jgi:hypothetical protein